MAQNEVISIPFRVVVSCVAGLPLSALLLCVLTSLLIHFQQATSTHCGVQNWLPSVSAATATYSPEKYIWRTLISLHIAPRFFLAIAYRNFLITSPLQPLSNTCTFRLLCQISCVLQCVENFFLLMLTVISSTENHTAHAVCFGAFIISSLMYMILSTWLYSYSGRRRAFSTSIGEASFEYKCLASSLSFISVVVAAYLYYRHNTYCEPGVYTLFAFSEYMIIVTNIAFHSTLYLDFHGKSLSIRSSSLGDQYEMLLPTLIDKDT